MSNDTTGLSNAGKKLTKIIDKCFDRKIKEVNIPYFKNGVITSIASNELSATVTIDGAIRTVTMTKGSEVAVGDVVKVLYDGTSAKNGIVITKAGINSLSPTKTSFICTPSSTNFTFTRQNNYILFDEAHFNFSVNVTTALSANALVNLCTVPFTPVGDVALSIFGYSTSKDWSEKGLCYLWNDGKIYISLDNSNVTSYRISGIVEVKM